MRKFKTREELLQDTINYYWGKPERRCIDEMEGKCQYKSSKTSAGCAIGRLVPHRLAVKLSKSNKPVTHDEIFYALPKWLSKMGKGFLYHLQNLHDDKHFVNCDKTWVIITMEDHVDMSKIVFPEI